MESRYARQELLQGWDQQRLAHATLGIAGGGATAFLCGLMAAAMGFGRLVLMARAAQPLAGIELPAAEGEPLRAWARLFQRINPGVEVQVHTGEAKGGLPALDGLIAAGNDLAFWQAGSRIARQGRIPVVAGGCAGHLGLWGPAVIDRTVARLHRLAEAPLLSQIVAALLVEEVRKGLLPLPGEGGRADRLNLLALPVPSLRAQRGSWSLRVPWRGLALVGAGALGTWFGLGLGLLGQPLGLAIFDNDQIEETNLNRQVLFYEAVGQSKATVLAARLQEWFPHLKVWGYGMRVEERSAEQLRHLPLLVACPDNFAVRAFLNRLARQRDKTLISGGTSTSGGSCLLYEPGTTACLSCRLRIEHLAAQEQQPQRCAEQVQGSIVTSNALIGALMAWLVLGTLAGRAEAGMWEYDGRAQNDRLGRRSAWPPCQCHRQGRR